MKRLLALLLLLPLFAHAESFFQVEAGLGMSYTKTLGDGTWYQLGVPHEVRTYSPAFIIGVTGSVYSTGNFDVRYHLDYNFLGTQQASCVCVPDSEYNPHAHTASRAGYIPFSGGGFIHGVSLTLEPGYTYRGYRIGVEAGPFLFWDIWHESRFDPAYPTQNDLSHRAVAQLGYVAGASISRGPLSLRYRYYAEPQKWNPYPGLAHGTHMLLVTYIF